MGKILSKNARTVVETLNINGILPNHMSTRNAVDGEKKHVMIWSARSGNQNPDPLPHRKRTTNLNLSLQAEIDIWYPEPHEGDPNVVHDELPDDDENEEPM